MTVKRSPVKRSSLVKSMGYDKETRTLEIEFLGGQVYRYSNVGPKLYRACRRARSVGGYFNRYIKGSVEIPYERVR
jgi:hypothetical protein